MDAGIELSAGFYSYYIWYFAKYGIKRNRSDPEAWGTCAGEQRRFSEQQVMDCSWRDGNEACNGGDYDTAIDYLVQARLVSLPSSTTLPPWHPRVL